MALSAGDAAGSSVTEGVRNTVKPTSIAVNRMTRTNLCESRIRL